MSIVNSDTFDTTYRMVTAQDGGWFWEPGEYTTDGEVHDLAHTMFGGLDADDYAVVKVTREVLPGRNR